MARPQGEVPKTMKMYSHGGAVDACKRGIDVKNDAKMNAPLKTHVL